MAQPWYSREIFFQQSPTHTAAMFHVKQSALTELHPENIQPAAKCNQRLLASLARDSKKWPVPPPTLSSAGVEWRRKEPRTTLARFPAFG